MGRLFANVELVTAVNLTDFALIAEVVLPHMKPPTALERRNDDCPRSVGKPKSILARWQTLGACATFLFVVARQAA